MGKRKKERLKQNRDQNCAGPCMDVGMKWKLLDDRIEASGQCDSALHFNHPVAVVSVVASFEGPVLSFGGFSHQHSPL